jgi:putative modified peptide
VSLPTLPPNIALELINRLSSDDVFRTLFTTDPGAALEAVGFPAADAEQLRICCVVGELASKEAICAAKEELQTMLTALLNQTVPALDASPGPGWTLKGP